MWWEVILPPEQGLNSGPRQIHRPGPGLIHSVVSVWSCWQTDRETNTWSGSEPPRGRDSNSNTLLLQGHFINRTLLVIDYFNIFSGTIIILVFPDQQQHQQQHQHQHQQLTSSLLFSPGRRSQLLFVDHMTHRNTGGFKAQPSAITTSLQHD